MSNGKQWYSLWEDWNNSLSAVSWSFFMLERSPVLGRSGFWEHRIARGGDLLTFSSCKAIQLTTEAMEVLWSHVRILNPLINTFSSDSESWFVPSDDVTHGVCEGPFLKRFSAWLTGHLWFSGARGHIWQKRWSWRQIKGLLISVHASFTGVID